MFKKYLLGLVLFVGLTSAQASFLFEPYVGHSPSGNGDRSYTASGFNIKEDYTSSGLHYGARAGLQFKGLMLGAEYGMGKIEIEDTTTIGSLIGTPQANDYTRTSIGAFLGYELPVMFRLWGTYYFSEKVDKDGTSGGNDGTGYSLGLGYKGLPLLSLNVEYRMFSYDKHRTDSGIESDLDPVLDTSEILVSVSFPFTI